MEGRQIRRAAIIQEHHGLGWGRLPLVCEREHQESRGQRRRKGAHLTIVHGVWLACLLLFDEWCNKMRKTLCPHAIIRRLKRAADTAPVCGTKQEVVPLAGSCTQS
jgi:hypothetical protein